MFRVKITFKCTFSPFKIYQLSVRNEDFIQLKWIDFFCHIKFPYRIRTNYYLKYIYRKYSIIKIKLNIGSTQEGCGVRMWLDVLAVSLKIWRVSFQKGLNAYLTEIDVLKLNICTCLKGNKCTISHYFFLVTNSCFIPKGTKSKTVSFQKEF